MEEGWLLLAVRAMAIENNDGSVKLVEGRHKLIDAADFDE